MYDSVWKKNLCLHVKKPIILLNWAEMVFFSSDDLPLKAQFRSWPFDPIGQIRNEHYKERKKIVNFKEIFLKNFCLKIKKGLLFLNQTLIVLEGSNWIVELLKPRNVCPNHLQRSDHLISLSIRQFINEKIKKV